MARKGIVIKPVFVLFIMILPSCTSSECTIDAMVSLCISTRRRVTIAPIPHRSIRELIQEVQYCPLLIQYRSRKKPREKVTKL